MLKTRKRWIKVKKGKHEKFKTGNMSIQAKLILWMLVLSILPVVIVGLTLFSNAEKTITEKISLFSQQKIVQNAQKIDMKLSEFNELQMNFLFNERINNVLTGSERYENAYEKLSAVNEIESVMSTTAVTNDGIDTIVYIPTDEEIIGRKIMSTGRPYKEMDFIRSDDFRNTDLYKRATSEKMETVWITGFNGNYGSVLLAKPVANFYDKEVKGILIYIIDQQVFGDLFVQQDRTDGGKIVLLNADSAVVSAATEEELGGSIEAEYEGVLRTEHKIYSNDEVLFTYEECMNGWVLAESLSKDKLFAEINTLKTNLIIYIAAAGILALVAARIISRGIYRPLKNIQALMVKAAEGDFTATSPYGGKNEIGVLIKSYNEMISNVSALIENTKRAIEEVNVASGELAQNSVHASRSVDAVARAVDEIALGATQQANDADHGARLTIGMDEQFKVLNEISLVMNKEATEATHINKKGMEVVDTLRLRTKENMESTKDVEYAVAELEKRSNAIGSIVETISAISDQTNLLALNASIEAARAGEAGRGFAVVANEIRNLAEQSNQAANEIRGIIQAIQEDSRRTVETMQIVTNRSQQQSHVVLEVDKAFIDISETVHNIAEKISLINENILEISDSKNRIVESIENISSVSQQTAASSQHVSASMLEQSQVVNSVSASAQKLTELAEVLTEEVSAFKVV